MQIRDFGSGISPDMAHQLGKPFVSTKGPGRGLGLFLANAAIERAGGTVKMENHVDAGTMTTVQLPISNEA
jgi:two-component system sensor histidine kinase RegB